jgi:hypothetical protein
MLINVMLMQSAIPICGMIFSMKSIPKTGMMVIMEHPII